MTAEQLEELLGRVTQGDWKVGYRAMDVGISPCKIGGYAKLFDVRGWGYLTGKGHGALGLSEDVAIKQQEANAELAALAPSLARRVIAAEKLAEAIYDDASDQWWANVNKAATAYREARK